MYIETVMLSKHLSGILVSFISFLFALSSLPSDDAGGGALQILCFFFIRLTEALH